MNWINWIDFNINNGNRLKIQGLVGKLPHPLTVEPVNTHE